ncbi:TPA: hypothetical protein NQO38_000179 [Pseudomonas aeruginosa]|uniref:hypothetical protein n=1 Tax=Pseudomonas aeruginosa TaxID=287 RepID=UPI000FFB88D8|nr:hypothetical protein [Pseudomonas aeruginosa]UTQ46974.1 hypothetical protein MMZ69_08950 [Pseudomonas aeruginosa]HBO5186971.1 hypothetical protein [Pseudomonas aeruginosa]HCI3011980.1 hypothetical protein [Pseudomonas aeruginosa]HCJ0542754.1 hypothetical protein [Pseudomonas aeruginosa]HCJ0714269.1 hypothetical protein [Pseudomonas aeruginosa]
MTKANECTCPSGDGSLRHPCPAHPASVELAGVGAKLTFINGRPAMCGCQVEYSSGGGEYSDVIYVTLCAKHSGSAILDLVATNRIALTPEYEGQWHADLYLDREIPLAKAEGATPAEAVLALMSAERIDPEQESVEQAGGNERAAFESRAEDAGSDISRDDFGNYVNVYVQTEWEGWQARAALAQPSPVRSSLLINGYQLRAALDFIAPDGTAEQLESEACIEWRQQDADFLEAGLYAFCAEYPEEGGVLLDEEPTTAQPSPLQSEQAEAERPEVVGYLATAEHPKHGQPHKAFNYFKDQHDAQVAHWRERGCEVSDDELMTVAQHGRIVGALRARNEKLEADAGALEWLRSTFKVHKAIVEQAGCGTIEQLAEQRDAANSRLHEVSVACATAEQERDAALARIAELEAALSSALSQHGVKFMDPPDGGDTPLIEQVCRMSQALSELEKQEPVGEVRESGGTLTAVIVRHSYATKLPVGTKLYAAPVSQAQRSVPEEFSFEYRHPNGECHTVTVSREQVINEMPDFLFEALCSKLCNCEPVGETNVVECRCDEYAEEFKLIAAAPGNEGV